MPLLVPLHSIILSRGDARVIPEVGKAFDFSAEEAKHLKPTSFRPATGADPVGYARRAVKGNAVVEATRRRQGREAEAIGKGVAKALAEQMEAIRRAAMEGAPPPAEPVPLQQTGAGQATGAGDENGGL